MTYVSGQVAWRPNGEPAPDSLVEQMKFVSQNEPHDIVVAGIYVVNLTPERMEELMPPFLATFEKAQPCVTGIGVDALAQ